MATLYFETIEGDDLRKTGFPKDGKPQWHQVFLELLVGHGGNPIGYELFEGNIFEGNTFIPVLQCMEKRLNLDKPIVIADSGLLSKKNISVLEEDGYEYILGTRPTKANINNKGYKKYLKMDGEVFVSLPILLCWN